MTETYKAVISRIEPGSQAQAKGLQAGDTIVSVNGKPVQDLIDLNYELADENISVVVSGHDGPKECYFQKRFGEDLGITMESAVFDSIEQCRNGCIFCFIAQMPQGMRPSLYVRDDDYRMSFLTGSFITLSNLTKDDLSRISPLSFIAAARVCPYSKWFLAAAHDAAARYGTYTRTAGRISAV
jgi:NifB/MoaA-like Fe-S oxidoreductase